MSEQILLPGFRGDVVLVDGLCYEFTGYTAQPPEDLQVTAKFNTCDECGPSSSGFSAEMSSMSSMFSSVEMLSSAVEEVSSLAVDEVSSLAVDEVSSLAVDGVSSLAVDGVSSLAVDGVSSLAAEEGWLYTLCPGASSEFASSSAAPVLPGPNCNNCDGLGTQLSYTYIATFTGLCSHYTSLNNRPTLFTWTYNCRFLSDYTDNGTPWYPYYLFFIYWETSAAYPDGVWKITLHPTPNSSFEWTGPYPADPCDPTGIWGSHTACSDMFGTAHCDPLTTCVVSLP